MGAMPGSWGRVEDDDMEQRPGAGGMGADCRRREGKEKNFFHLEQG
jgi:hypothetical protein